MRSRVIPVERLEEVVSAERQTARAAAIGKKFRRSVVIRAPLKDAIPARYYKNDIRNDTPADVVALTAARKCDVMHADFSIRLNKLQCCSNARSDVF